MAIVKSEKAITPSEYVKKVFGANQKIVSDDKLKKMTSDDLRDLLDENDFIEVWDFPLSEIDELVEHGNPVVLVRFGDGDEAECRWFELPEEAVQ